MGSYYIHTFGCQMNFHDSEKIEAMLVSDGHKKASSMNSADIIIFNTCTIREKAYQKATSAIGRLKHKKNKIIAICGCAAQQGNKNLLNKYPQINIVCGPDQIHNLSKMIANVKNKPKIVKTDFINDDTYPFTKETIPIENGSAYITIIKGCDCKCSYCIVPSVRGSEVSRNPDDIIDEINLRLAAGAKEIILLGQNVNRYRYYNSHCKQGEKISDRHVANIAPRDDTKTHIIDFPDLIQKILDDTDVERLRFVSPHPTGFNDKLINLFSDKRLCEHVHLPLQSGSNDILKKMRRGYTREKYIEIINKLRKTRPNIAIGTDIIVGFCGETEKDYNDTVDLLKEVEFDSIFAFAYSPRPNTPSFEWKDDVPDKIKNERLNNLLTIQEKISKKRNKTQVLNIIDVLVVSKDPLERGMLKGRANDNRTVIFSGNKSLIGNIVKVKVKDFGANSLIGELI